MTDPAIDAIRAVRKKISASFDHDVEKLFAHYVALQEQHPERTYLWREQNHLRVGREDSTDSSSGS